MDYIGGVGAGTLSLAVCRESYPGCKYVALLHESFIPGVLYIYITTNKINVNLICLLQLAPITVACFKIHLPINPISPIFLSRTINKNKSSLLICQ